MRSACACTAADVCCCVHVYTDLDWIQWVALYHMVAFPPCAVQVNQLFDNGGTVFFAIVMSFWGECLIFIHIE